MGNGHNMSTASWDNTEAALMFNIDPFPVIAEKKVDFGIKLMMDNKTGNNISHMTYLITITKEAKGYLSSRYIPRTET